LKSLFLSYCLSISLKACVDQNITFSLMNP
jgi:hypothetical protein